MTALSSKEILIMTTTMEEERGLENKNNHNKQRLFSGDPTQKIKIIGYLNHFKII